nr:histidine kinase dimerization/phospho-acceptor domain-containing protein [uncultured Desulfobulbus sp.]
MSVEKAWQNNAPEDEACLCHTQELISLEQLEREKSRLMGELAGSLAHELNNPLCGVTAFLERLSRHGSLTGQDAHLLPLALAQCTRMKALLKDIQAVMGPHCLKKEVTDLQQVLNFVMRLLHKQLKLFGVLVHPLQLEDPIWVIGNEQQLRQMLLQLLFTVGRALAGAGGELTLQSLRHADEIRLIIQCQVAPSHYEQLLQLFDQLRSSQLPLDSDTAIVHSILELQGVTMQITQPVQGIGAMVFTLPIEHADM